MTELTRVEDSFTIFLEDFKKDGGQPFYEREISRMVIEGRKSLVVDFIDLYSFFPELAHQLIDNSVSNFHGLDSALLSKLQIRHPGYLEVIKKPHVRLRNLPHTTGLRKISTSDIVKLIQIKGIITQTTEVLPFIIKAAFRCTSCGELMMIDQTDQNLHIPPKCTSCNSRRGFELVPNKSKFIDYQRITIQERPEELPSGQLPKAVNIELMEDLVNKANPGDRINAVGLLKLIKRIGRGGILRVFSTVLEANNIEVFTKDDEILEITESDIEKIKELSKDPWLMRRIIQSIAPSIYGYDYIKEGIAYQLFEGVTTQEIGGVSNRGLIHILLIGDPGVGKSQILMYVANQAPRGILTTGRGTTAAGLTAAVVKEKGTDGTWILMAGALVLADKGICCIDEMDKMREEDRGSIHPAMAQGKFSINKGGINAQLNARTSILGAANPTLGRYNPYQNIAQNISTFPIPLLTRFDLIFLIRDIPEEKKDSEIFDHMAKVHQNKKIENINPIEPLLLKKYIAYSKHIKPRLTDEVVTAFGQFYTIMRAASIEGGEASAISITPRQAQVLFRLAQARARIHLREETTIEDANAAIALLSRSLEQVGIDPTTGEADIDLLYSGKPRSLQMQLSVVLEVILKLEKITGAVQDENLFTAMLEDHGIGRSETARLIGVLMRDGTIYSPRPGHYKRTQS